MPLALFEETSDLMVEIGGGREEMILLLLSFQVVVASNLELEVNCCVGAVLKGWGVLRQS
jgi:hypothetical protein